MGGSGGRGGGGGRGGKKGGRGKGKGPSFSMPVPKFLRGFQAELPGAAAAPDDGYDGGMDAGADIVAGFLQDRLARGDEAEDDGPTVVDAATGTNVDAPAAAPARAPPAKSVESIEPTRLPDDREAPAAAAPTFKRPGADGAPRRKKRPRKANPTLLSFGDDEQEA